jgi:undecaprenyl-diphosphatase
MSRVQQPGVLAALAVGLWLAALGLGLFIANLATVPTADLRIALALHDLAHQQRWLVGTATFFAIMGSAVVLTPLTVGVVVVLARRGHRWWAMWVAACGMGGWMISQTVKHLVDRQRPEWPDPFAVLTTPSFPSGHSMAGIYGYVVFGIVALALLPRRWPGIAVIVFGMLMGPSRVLLGVHWPTDVLMGWLLAGAWVCTAAAIVLRVRGRPQEAG